MLILARKTRNPGQTAVGSVEFEATSASTAMRTRVDSFQSLIAAQGAGAEKRRRHEDLLEITQLASRYASERG
jgi:hypothetical protein